MLTQVSARQSCPKRNERRGGKSWRPNEPSVKLLKDRSNWAHASWTDERGVGRESEEHGPQRLDQGRGCRPVIPQVKDQEGVLAMKKTVNSGCNGGGLVADMFDS